MLILPEVAGKVQVWLEGKLIGERKSSGKVETAMSLLIETPIAKRSRRSRRCGLCRMKAGVLQLRDDLQPVLVFRFLYA
jgi:hypothetical protein